MIKLGLNSKVQPRQNMQPDATDSPGSRFEKLVGIMARLRAPDGCPWDREQTFDSVKPYTLEETYEVLDAIDRRAWDELPGELGDFLLQAVFYAQMASETGHFKIDDCLDAINEKLIRRHPHIFGEEKIATGDAVLKRWNEIKAAERAGKADKPQGLLDTVPRALPALVEAQQISSRAARTGFDWADSEQVIDKIHEEIAEIREATDHRQREDEIGDLLFAVVNLARFLKVDPEQALRGTNSKFRRRFGHMESRLREQNKPLDGAPIDHLESLWREAKANEKSAQ